MATATGEKSPQADFHHRGGRSYHHIPSEAPYGIWRVAQQTEEIHSCSLHFKCLSKSFLKNNKWISKIFSWQNYFWKDPFHERDLEFPIPQSQFGNLFLPKCPGRQASAAMVGAGLVVAHACIDLGITGNGKCSPGKAPSPPQAKCSTSMPKLQTSAWGLGRHSRGRRPTKLCSNGGLEASESLRAQAERHAGWNVLRIGAEDNHQGIV